jgi:hypothetical protein
MKTLHKFFILSTCINHSGTGGNAEPKFGVAPPSE